MKSFILLALFITAIDCQLLFPGEYDGNSSSGTDNEWQRPPFPAYSPVSNFQNVHSIGVVNPSNPYPGNQVEDVSILVPSSSLIPPSHGISPEEMYWSNYVNNIIARGVMKYSLDMDRAITASQRTLPLEKDPENVVFSPISLVGTLALVLLGSAGKTFDEIIRILGFNSGVDISGHSEIFHRMFGSLLNTIDPRYPSNSGGPLVSFANGVFVQDGYPIRQEFLALSQSVYRSEVKNVDFLYRSETARNVINNWVNKKTHGKIKNILTQSLDPDTRVIFASALYFNGEWNQHFIDSGTRRRSFTLTSGRDVEVDMMFNSGYFPFYEDKQLGMKIVGLPYANSERLIDPSDFSLSGSTMYILLPTSSSADAWSRLEARLTPDTIEALISQMESKRCIIGLPRMKLSSTLNLKRALESLGLTSLFLPNEANLGLLSPGVNSKNGQHSNPSFFSRIDNGELGNSTETPAINSTEVPAMNSTETLAMNSTETEDSSKTRKVRSGTLEPEFIRFMEAQGFPNYGIDALRNSANLINPGLYASEVIHKVEMDITETGTVAAAATSVIILRDGRAKLFTANRPFKFFIRHEPSRSTLFWGSINKPTPHYPLS